jgi:ABC-type sugar transport system ATPase subunit
MTTASDRPVVHEPDDWHVETRRVVKYFGGTEALKNVDVSVRRGSIHGLVGENGAGKSTLGRVIAGAISPDEGELLVDGRPVRFRSPREALRAGITVIAQELALAPKLSVLENVFLGIEPVVRGFLSRRAARERFHLLNERTGFGLDAGTRVGSLRVADQQKVEILRALARDARLLIMDEPTAALPAQDKERLLEIVRTLRDDGVTIVYVSHFLDEILEISDDITILRDGRVIRASRAAEETSASLIKGMVGREMGLAFPARGASAPDAPVVLSARGLSSQKIKDLDLDVRAGEIVGVAGLMGSGRTSLARLLFGLDSATSGEIQLFGESVRLRSPRDAIRRGVALVPESRKEEGLVMPRTVRENLALVYGRDVARRGVISDGREKEMVGDLMRRLDVRGRAADPVWKLSGGNQQKVAVAKWLWRDTRLLIVDEPARGIDIAAKHSMYRLIANLANEGAAVLMISSDIEELVGLSDRVVVLRHGAIAGEFNRGEIDEHAIVATSFGEPGPTVRSGSK